MTAALLATACAHEVVWLGPDERYAPPPAPLSMTVGVGIQSFSAARVTEAGVLDRFVSELRDARLFQGVLAPIPAGVEPLFELRLLVRDKVDEADANLWKSALARGIFPLGFVIWMETDYVLELEALLTRRDEVIGSYATESPVRYRFQTNANVPQMEREGLELILRRATEQILAAIAADAARIEREDQSRAGR